MTIYNIIQIIYKVDIYDGHSVNNYYLRKKIARKLMFYICTSTMRPYAKIWMPVFPIQDCQGGQKRFG